MFITRKAYEMAIKKAIKETEERMWREHDEYIVRKRREREMEVTNRRLKVIEEKLGINVPEDIECGFLI